MTFQQAGELTWRLVTTLPCGEPSRGATGPKDVEILGAGA
jgi:hypothetical protein